MHGTTSTGTSWRWSARYDALSCTRCCCGSASGAAARLAAMYGSQLRRYASARAARLSGSVTTIQRQPCALPPVRAWIASRRAGEPQALLDHLGLDGAVEVETPAHGTRCGEEVIDGGGIERGHGDLRR